MPLFPMWSRTRSLRVVPISIAADGTTESRNVTSVKSATGTYQVTLNRSTQQTLFPFPQVVADGVARHLAQVTVSSLTAKFFEIKTYTLGDVAADAPVDILLVGMDGASGAQFNVVPSKVMATLTKPRLLQFYYDGAGDSVYSRHRWDGTFTKNSTGNYTLTLKNKFQQTPIFVVLTSSTNRAVEVSSKTNGGCLIETFAAATATAADAEIFVLVLGSDARQIFQRREHELKTNVHNTFINPYEYDFATNVFNRAGTMFSAVKNGTGDSTITRKRNFPKAGFGIAIANGAASQVAINTRTFEKFNLACDTDAKILGLDIGYAFGRD